MLNQDSKSCIINKKEKKCLKQYCNCLISTLRYEALYSSRLGNHEDDNDDRLLATSAWGVILKMIFEENKTASCDS